MVTEIDTKTIAADLEGATGCIDEAAALGRDFADKFDRIYFVACGAPNRTMLGLQYWLERESPSFEVRRYFPAEFMTLDPARMDDRTLVVLGSKSGTTQETVDAAVFCQDKPVTTVGVTEIADRPLAKAVDHPLLMGEGSQAHPGIFIVLQALVAGLMAGRDGWALESKMLSSLRALPKVLGDAQMQVEARTAEEARIYNDDRILYHVGSGPMFATSYVFGVCVLMEMQWMHSTALEAAEFFHGPFEVVDQDLPLVLYLGEDPSRPLMERVVRFCRKYTERLMIYDTRDFPMEGVDPEIRAYVAPTVLCSALDRLSQKLAVWHAHPLSTRRYMWCTKY